MTVQAKALATSSVSVANINLYLYNPHQALPILKHWR